MNKSKMASFPIFLQSECTATVAFIDEIGDIEISLESVNLKINRSLRVAIIDHLITFDFNISLLMEIVETYCEISELIEWERNCL
jgi:hypothetical protein